MISFNDRFGLPIMIRPFNDTDYESARRIGNIVWPDFPSTVEELRFRDANHDPKIKWGRFVAEANGEAVGLASYSQGLGMYHPNKFHVDISVLPQWEGRGIGGALYDTLLEMLAQHDAILMRTEGREDRKSGLRFVEKRGFVEEMREWESRLDVTLFQSANFADRAAVVEQSGIVIKSLTELADDPDRDRKLYEMNWLVALDVPAPDERTKPTFEQFWKRLLGNPGFFPEGWFIAMDGENYVGESTLWKSQAEDGLHVGTTGVLREYRRRNIAFALKLRAIEFAKGIGCPELKTWNEQNNVGMLAINNALGFVRQPAWISFAKTVREA